MTFCGIYAIYTTLGPPGRDLSTNFWAKPLWFSESAPKKCSKMVWTGMFRKKSIHWSPLLKLSDMVRFSNCLLVHDFIQKVLPDCFADYFEKLEIKYTDFKTKNSELGNLFVPSWMCLHELIAVDESIYSDNFFLIYGRVLICEENPCYYNSTYDQEKR